MKDVLALRRELPGTPGITALLAERDQYLQALYPDRVQLRHAVESAANEFGLYGLRQGGRLVGCGSLVRHSTFMELKKVFLTASARGKGLGQHLLATIETEARAAGCALLRLEVGTRQEAAFRLYRRMAYIEVGPFPPYRAEITSRFMEKRLEA